MAVVKMIDRYDKENVRGVDTLTLNNNRQDGSRVHQLIGYPLFRDAGCRRVLQSGTRHGQRQIAGIYSNVESLDKRLFRRAFDSAKAAVRGYGL